MYLKFVVPFTFLPYKNYIEHKYVQEIVVQYVQKQIKTKIKTKPKNLKVFRLKAAILGLKFVNLMRFNCSLLSKTCLKVYRPTSQGLYKNLEFHEIPTSNHHLRNV